MADHDEMHAQVMAALRAAKPVTRDSALEIAMGVLKPLDVKAAAQFESWFKTNGQAVVEIINGP